MKIPNGPSGFPTVSASMLTTYGAAGLELEDVEPKGCPRKFEAKYVSKTLPNVKSDRMKGGLVVHQVWQRMEEDGLTPDEALAASFDPTLPPDVQAEIERDVENYLARESTPFLNYATLRVEERLTTLLYTDDVHGPVYVQGIVDRIAIDYDTPNVVHIGDWKWVQNPPSVDDVRNSVQFAIYSYLVRNCWQELGLPQEPVRIVVHLDAIKWYELPGVEFTSDEMVKWHSYLVNVCRAILRDTEAKPVINWGCAYCPIKDTCPAYQALPDHALSLLQIKPDDRDSLARWVEKVRQARLLLQKAEKEVADRFEADTRQLGEVHAGGMVWRVEQKWTDSQDTRRLHELLGDEFYDVAEVAKGKLTAVAATKPPSVADRLWDCLIRVPAGSRIVKKKE